MNYYKKKTEAAERAQARRELENAAPRLAAMGAHCSQSSRLLFGLAI